MKNLQINDVELTDWEYNSNDLNVYATGVFYVDNGNDSVLVTFNAYVSYDDIEFTVEPCGKPTYVSYGEQEVMYDNGDGRITDINLKKATDVDWEELYVNLDDEALYLTEASNILGCTDEELKSLLNETVNKGVVFDYVIKWLRKTLLNDDYIDKAYDKYMEEE